MKHFIELRVSEEYAHLLFSENEGRRLGQFVRKIVIDVNDPRYTKVPEIINKVRRIHNDIFFAGWHIEQRPSSADLKTAYLLLLQPTRFFMPFGEECGTVYDDSMACPQCGCGEVQIGPLHMSVRNIPKADVASTMAHEIVVSRRLVECFKANDVTGVTFTPVQTKKRGDAPSEQWFQMTVNASTVEIIPPTQTGNDPFDLDPGNEGRCPVGPLVGLNLISDVTVRHDTWGAYDIMATRQFIGVRHVAGTPKGYLKPRHLILVSQKIRKLIEAEKLKGVRLEVAFLG